MHASFAHVLIKLLFLRLPGQPGVPGQRGGAGPEGPKGIQGESGKVGVTYIRWGKKTCPNTGATLAYEGNNKTVCIPSQRVSTYMNAWRGGIYDKYKFQL
jgi:hypothetical protein